jgi:hypothetical protein
VVEDQATAAVAAASTDAGNRPNETGDPDVIMSPSAWIDDLL